MLNYTLYTDCVYNVSSVLELNDISLSSKINEKLYTHPYFNEKLKLYETLMKLYTYCNKKLKLYETVMKL